MIETYCDECRTNISRTTKSQAFRLALTVEAIPPVPGKPLTLMAVYPPIDRDAHFCGLECLRAWLGEGDR